MNIKELLKDKRIINWLIELRKPINKRGYDLEFFSIVDKVGFNIVEKKENID